MPDPVSQIFRGVVSKYDLANRILSLDLDVGWRKRTVTLTGIRPCMRILDLCCGTGDMAFIAAEAAGDQGQVVGCDKVPEMLVMAQARSCKLIQRGKLSADSIQWLSADCLDLPFEDNRFDAVTCAFGIRNVSNVELALRQICRVLRPGGRVGILEFSLPQNPILRWLHAIYLTVAVPLIGGLITGRFGAYAYLARSIRKFSRDISIPQLLANTGFTAISSVPLSGEIVTVYTAEKPKQM